VNNNYINIQNNFDSIQANFERLFAATKGKIVEQLGHILETPPNPEVQSAASVSKQHELVKIGNCTLQDDKGQELHLDGTSKIPYRHPNVGQVTTFLREPTHKQGVPARMNNNVHQPQQDVNQNEGIMMNNLQRAPCEEQLEGRRGIRYQAGQDEHSRVWRNRC
jgi:hypothetical protein